MSTIKVSNIRIASESVSRPVTGVAAAWAVGNANSTIVQNSLNVSSGTDVAGGKTTYALTSPMSGGRDTFSFSGSLMNTDADRYVIGWSTNTTSSVIGVLRGDPSDGRLVEGPLSWSILGELA